MAYASVDDMVKWFGAAEMTRLSTPDGAEATIVHPAPINLALENASATIDTYLRKRYQVPLEIAPAEITRVCCQMARYDLSTGGDRTPGEQTKDDRKDAIAWLRDIATGKVVLDLAEVAPGEESYATAQSRHQVFGADDAGGFEPGFGFWNGDR